MYNIAEQKNKPKGEKKMETLEIITLEIITVEYEYDKDGRVVKETTTIEVAEEVE
jgi:hypothetical protein